MKSIFAAVTRFSLRFRVVTLAVAALLAVLGVIAITQLKQELIPPIEFPQSVILTQVSGMSSEEVLAVLTERLEDALADIDEIANLESTTTGAFGSVIIARNDFGLDQERLRGEIQAALNRVWLPQRRIAPPAGQDTQAFAAELLGDLPADVVIYLAESDPNFLFQLSPDVWNAFSDETLEQTLAYLAGQVEQNSGAVSALHRLVEQEVVPQLEALDVVASISISGGQVLPGEESEALITSAPIEAPEASSLLLQLSPDVWQVVSSRLDGLGALDENAVADLRAVSVTIPESAPMLPESWQMDHFRDATDLLEMRTLTRSVAGALNAFYETGEIVGALGQTDDLTPEDVTRMLEIAPSMVQYFGAEQLAAMPPEVFAVLPDEFIAGLDGFTRDELAAAALAESLTGRGDNVEPADLPSAWRIQPPQLISFSFDDIPLASFSVFGSGEASGQELASADNPGDSVNDTSANNDPEQDSNEPVNSEPAASIPEGPALPPIYALMGLQFGAELDTADDLINIQLPPEAADQLGTDRLRAADLLNFMVMLADPDSLPPGVEVPPVPLDPGILIGGLSPEAVAFLAEHDPTFLPNLSPDVFNAFSDAVLALPEIAPPLPDVWDTLASKPQFEEMPLRNARDLLELGDGRASSVLNTINETVPERFSGYEVRLFDSLTPALARYFALHEPDFFTNLDVDVLRKLSPEVLVSLPEDVLDSLDDAVAAELQAIASGEQPSAAAVLAERYTTNVPAADPSAPPISDAWGMVANFYGIELDSADDFFRFPDNFPFDSVSAFWNSFFESPQGTAFAPNLFGGLTADAVTYMLDRDPTVFDGLRPEALQLLTEDVLALLPEPLQERAVSGGEPFVPAAAVTRLNGFPSLLLTVFKTSDANTVEAFHTVEDALTAISEANEDIDVDVAFEQASFIEESISGVAREGGLGAFFAVIVILAFLSSGVWNRSAQRTTGLVLAALAAVILAVIVLSRLGSAGGDLALAFSDVDILMRTLLIGVAAAGVLIAIWPRSLPSPAWRSTLVTAVSIPLSVLMALAFMRWVPPVVHDLLAPAAGDSPILTFLLRLFPESITLNIMTLSGLTVAIGRVVDDSIVVLENVFREIQEGGDRRRAIIKGTRDVSVAIFSATAVTVVVFLPLGLTGGIIGAFFLPFGLAVTYSLAASFIVAITIVPLLAYIFISEDETMGEEEGWLSRLYLPILRWSLSSSTNRWIVLGAAAISLVIGGLLFASRPAAFLPSFGEPQITVNVSLPSGTRILETNALVEQFEEAIHDVLPEDEIGAVQVIVGDSGMGFESLLTGGGGVTENAAQITIAVESAGDLDALTQVARAQAEAIFGPDNVSVSGGAISDQGFGGFAVVLSGPPEELAAVDSEVIETLNSIEGITNVTSNLSQVGEAGGGADTYIRVDRQSAVRYTGELETENTIGITREAIKAIEALPDLPPDVTVSQGFESEMQTAGFAGLFTAMGIAIVIVIFLLIVTFGSLVHWVDIMLSVIVAPVGAAIALTLTNRVLGISAMIGMLMLIGIVVTNAVVLIDRVMANRRERHMDVHDALVEAGGRRLRPILMTAVATIFALIPLAIGLSEGAIIASELGTVVIGGLFSSTLLTLIVVPVAYSLLNPLHERVSNLLGRNKG